MEKYLGVKLLGAKPMTRGEFAEYKYHKEINEGFPEDEGYLVEYEGGYQSWSPKDVFEKAYRKIKSISDIKGLVVESGSFKERVYNEAWDLESNTAKLDIFIRENKVFVDLPNEEQNRLKQQLMAMQYYLTILIERIENF